MCTPSRKTSLIRPPAPSCRPAAAFAGLLLALAPIGVLAQDNAAATADAATAANGTPAWRELVGLSLQDIDPSQWIALLVLLGLAHFLGALILGIVRRIMNSVTRRTATTLDDELLERAVSPARLAASVAIFYVGTTALNVPEQVGAFIAIACEVLLVIAAVWLLSRLIDLFSAKLESRLSESGNTASVGLVPTGRRIAKVFIYVLAILSVLQNLGFNISGLLAGLGIGGLAVALAAQKTLENLFGGFTIVADRAMRVGEYCRVGEHVGTIEDIGMRSSRIRTADRTVVTVPNAELSSSRIENYGVRDRLRLYTVLQFGYDTSPDQMRYLLVELRRMLYAHPKVLPNPCRVRFINFGAHSLDIEIFVFVDSQDWNEFTGVREDIFLRILEIVNQSGACFAFPSQTLYLGRDAGRDMERTAAAEAAVRNWKSSGTMPIPEFPEPMIAEVAGTLDYPPEGSADHAPSPA